MGRMVSDHPTPLSHDVTVTAGSSARLDPESHSLLHPPFQGIASGCVSGTVNPASAVPLARSGSQTELDGSSRIRMTRNAIHVCTMQVGLSILNTDSFIRLQAGVKWMNVM